jgi:hypothetical protein
LRGPGAALVLLVVVSSVLRTWAGLRLPTPWIAPDELVYGMLARNLYDAGGWELLGEPVDLYSFLYPALLGVPLSLADVGDGYALAKAGQAVAMSLTAVPVYFWGRAVVGPRLALVAAAATLALPGLAYSGLLMTEVVFLPLATAAAWAAARALERPTLGRQAVLVAALLAAGSARLAAVVLVPALATAAVLHALLVREWRAGARLWPAFAALAVPALGWAAWRLKDGGPLSRLLAGYQAAGEVSYDLGDSLRYVLYHLGDLVLMTAFFPVAALVVLLALRRPEPPAAAALLAVATSLALWLPLQVGVYATRFTGHVAERGLLAAAPPLFLVLALWVSRGAPRPALPLALGLAVPLALAALFRAGEFATHAGIPDAFTLIPLYRLAVRAPGVDLDLVVNVLAVAAAAAFALVPRRLALALPLAVVALLAAVSVSASRVIASESIVLERDLFGGAQKDWIDRAADGDTTFVFIGDRPWTTVWQHAFWNERIARVYTLRTEVPGPLPQTAASIGPDGEVAPPSRDPYAASADRLEPAGERVADTFAAVVLRRVDVPLRIDRWTQGIRADRTIDPGAHVDLYDCAGAVLRATLVAPEPRTVELAAGAKPARTLRLEPGGALNVEEEVAPVAGRCFVELRTDGPVTVERLELERSD